MTGRTRARGFPIARGGVVALLLGSAGAVCAPPAAAQVDDIATAVAGTGLGLVAGVYSTTGIYVAKARFGSFIYSMYDVIKFRPETLPVFVMPIAGGVLGATSPGRLKDAVIWGGVGFVGGAATGALLGRWAWGGSEGTWAGGIVGSTIGLAAGAVIGALSDGDDPTEPAANRVLVSIPLRVSLF